MLLGAGTVTSRALAEGAIDAGAEFLVTPCVVPDVIAVAKARGVAVLPGAITPTEVFTAWSLGGDIIKIFPASNVGGASYLKALKGPFPQIPLCPTGGVNLQTIGDFVKAGAVGGRRRRRAGVEGRDRLGRLRADHGARAPVRRRPESRAGVTLEDDVRQPRRHGDTETHRVSWAAQEALCVLVSSCLRG